jgi:hypothetical protein
LRKQRGVVANSRASLTLFSNIGDKPDNKKAWENQKTKKRERRKYTDAENAERKKKRESGLARKEKENAHAGHTKLFSVLTASGNNNVAEENEETASRGGEEEDEAALCVQEEFPDYQELDCP